MAKDEYADFEQLKNYVLSVIPADINLSRLVVTGQQQQQELDYLKETIGNERFYFVVNLPDFELSHVAGVQKWLGYAERDFSLKKYWEYIVHPSRKRSLELIVRQMYALLCTGHYPLQFMVQRFATVLPVRHYNGHYLRVKKTASVFQYDNRNRLVAYLDEFTIVGDYEEGSEPISIRIFNNSGERESDKEKEILEQAFEHFLSMKVFSARELQVARKLAYDNSLTRQKLAEIFNVAPNTIETFCKRFLSKARDFFHIPFPSVLEAATYLRKEGLL